MRLLRCRAQPIMSNIKDGRVLRVSFWQVWVTIIAVGMVCGVASAQATTNPTPKFAYVANWYGGNVSAYTVNSSTGALRAVAGSPFAAGSEPILVAVDPSGRFVYVTNDCVTVNNCNSGNVSAYTINSSTGALAAIAGSPFAAGYFPRSVVVD